MVTGGTGVGVFYGGGLGSTVPGAGNSDAFAAGSASNDIFVGGGANTQMYGGFGGSGLMFGGTGGNFFQGGMLGHDTMVGGSSTNAFGLQDGDIAFGGASSKATDQFTVEAGTGLIVEGAGTESISMDHGNTVAFAGAGQDTYDISMGFPTSDSIIGFKSTDYIKLTGYNPSDVATVVKNETSGSYGTTLNFNDGSKIVLFGSSITASQLISVI